MTALEHPGSSTYQTINLIYII